MRSAAVNVCASAADPNHSPRIVINISRMNPPLAGDYEAARQPGKGNACGRRPWRPPLNGLAQLQAEAHRRGYDAAHFAHMNGFAKKPIMSAEEHQPLF